MYEPSGFFYLEGTLLWSIWTSGWEKSKLRCSIECGDVTGESNIFIICWAGFWTSSVFWTSSSVCPKSSEGSSGDTTIFKDLRQGPTEPFTKLLVSTKFHGMESTAHWGSWHTGAPTYFWWGHSRDTEGLRSDKECPSGWSDPGMSLSLQRLLEQP